MKRVLLAFLAVLLHGSGAKAATSVWKAEKDGSTVYLGGTCHVLREKDLPLPEEFDRAYQAADLLVFETDIGELQSPETQRRLVERASYPFGSTLDKHLPAATYDLIAAWCASNGLPVAQISRFRPSFAMVVLSVVELRKCGVTEEGVDAALHARARKDGKPFEGLETVDEQIRILTTLCDGFEQAFIEQSFRDLDKIREQIGEMLRAWREGDLPALDGLFVRVMKEETPEIYRRLLADRNEKWMDRLEAYGRTPRTEFVLVGVAHLAGEDGLIASLRRRGYRVTQM